MTSLFLFSDGAADVDAEAVMFVTDPEVPTSGDDAGGGAGADEFILPPVDLVMTRSSGCGLEVHPGVATGTFIAVL